MELKALLAFGSRHACAIVDRMGLGDAVVACYAAIDDSAGIVFWMITAADALSILVIAHALVALRRKSLPRYSGRRRIPAPADDETHVGSPCFTLALALSGLRDAVAKRLGAAVVQHLHRLDRNKADVNDALERFEECPQLRLLVDELEDHR